MNHDIVRNLENLDDLYDVLVRRGEETVYRGDFIIYWTGRPHKDISTSIKYKRGERDGTFVGKAKDSWLALQFAKSLGAGAEIKLYEVSLITLPPRYSDRMTLTQIEREILKHFDLPREPGTFILAKHRKPHSTQ